jgi:hypothetical protein
MKIAIIYSGFIRHFFKLVDNHNDFFFSNIEKNNNIDIFFHTWIHNGKKIKTKENRKNWNKNQKINRDLLIDTLNPKLYIIEDQLELMKKNIFKDKLEKGNTLKMRTNDIPYKHYFFQNYGIFKGLELVLKYEKKYNFKYDFICRIRFDIVFKEKFLFNLNNNIIIRDTGKGDKFILSNRKIMNNFIEFIYFNHIENYKLLKNIYFRGFAVEISIWVFYDLFKILNKKKNENIIKKNPHFNNNIDLYIKIKNKFNIIIPKEMYFIDCNI